MHEIYTERKRRERNIYWKKWEREREEMEMTTYIDLVTTWCIVYRGTFILSYKLHISRSRYYICRERQKGRKYGGEKNWSQGFFSHRHDFRRFKDVAPGRKSRLPPSSLSLFFPFSLFLLFFSSRFVHFLIMVTFRSFSSVTHFFLRVSFHL